MDHLFEDVIDISPPAAVDIGRYMILRIKKDDRLAVGLFDQNRSIREIGDHGIHGWGNQRLPEMMPFKKMHIRAVTLVHGDETGGVKGCLNGAQVGRHPIGPIPDRITRVQLVKRWGTKAALPREDTVDQAWIGGKETIVQDGRSRIVMVKIECLVELGGYGEERGGSPGIDLGVM